MPTLFIFRWALPTGNETQDIDIKTLEPATRKGALLPLIRVNTEMNLINTEIIKNFSEKISNFRDE